MLFLSLTSGYHIRIVCPWSPHGLQSIVGTTKQGGSIGVRRRDFIALVAGGAAIMRASATLAQQRARRVGVLSPLAEDDPEDRRRMAAFLEELQRFGWRNGENLRIEQRRHLGSPVEAQRQAVELIAFEPDVLLAGGSSSAGALLNATRSVPIVFVFTPDPVGAGFVDSLSRPGGNATGFSQFEYSLGGKWLELLREIAPRIRRVGVLRDLTIAAGTGQFAAIQSAAPPVGIELVPIGLRDAAEIERGVAGLARAANGGLIATAGPSTAVHRELIIALAARHRLPAVYYDRFFVTEGGLVSYGPDLVEQHRQAAGYVDRILRGEKPADLPVQAPTKYELAINLKTAKAIGIEIPATLLARADAIIE
jgi:putative tryptophan/tyrosine transport system substrate-binding protein